MCSFNLRKQHWEIPHGNEFSIFVGFVRQHLCWGGGIYIYIYAADRSEGIFKLLSSFKSQPNVEFHLQQIHFPTLILCL